MMDYHVHNHFSPDSEEDTLKIAEIAIKRGIKDICITNHPELHDEATGMGIFDLSEAIERFKKIKDETNEIQKEFPEINIGFGIELEYVEEWMPELVLLEKEVNFDFVLGSIHIVNGIIISSHLFADELYSQTDEETAYNAYFDEMLKLVEWGHLDAVAHFDICKKYGHKFYGPFKPEKYKDQIVPILSKMKEKDIGLELNTKCMDSKCQEIFPHPTILKWATEVGIKYFTFGSDAHKAENIGQHFDKAQRIAKEAGIVNIATYHKREPTLSIL
jgi:histidinol-phosphatase (PHP family)